MSKHTQTDAQSNTQMCAKYNGNNPLWRKKSICSQSSRVIYGLICCSRDIFREASSTFVCIHICVFRFIIILSSHAVTYILLFKKIFDVQKRIMYEINGWCRLFINPINQERPILLCHINPKMFHNCKTRSKNDKVKSSKNCDEITW